MNEKERRPILIRIFGKLMLAGFSFFILFLAGEILLRMKGTEKTHVRDYPWFDRGDKRYYSNPERLHPWTKNATNYLKVAVIGDSFSNAAGVLMEDGYGRRLERLLNYNSGIPPAAVHVYARGGTAPITQLKFLNMAIEWKPDVVVLGICLNDVEDGAYPDTHRKWHKEMLTRLPTGWKKSILDHSRIFSWLYTKKEQMRIKKAHVEYYRKLYSDEYHGWRTFRKALTQFKERTAKNDAKFMVMIFPMLGSNLDPSVYPFQHAHDKIHNLLDEMNITWHDLSDDFRGIDGKRVQAVPGLDGHPSEIGQRIAAVSLMQFMTENEIIDPRYEPKKFSRTLKFYDKLYQRFKDPVGYKEEQEATRFNQESSGEERKRK